MYGPFLFSLPVLLAALVPIIVEDNREFMAKPDERLSKALRTPLPLNISPHITYEQYGDFNPVNGTKCAEQLTLLQEGIINGSLWALKMIDASSKIPLGILTGNKVDLGFFDECIEISVYEDGQEIRGRHCMYKAMGELAGITINETLSICVPATCEPEQVDIILKSALKFVGELIHKDIPISIVETTCTSVDPPEWTIGGILTLTGFSLLLLFLVVSTICDVYTRYFGERPPRNSGINVICEFSFCSSASRVLSIKASRETLPVLQGLRFYSMCWIILCHVYKMSLMRPIINTTDVYHWISSSDSIYGQLGPFAVDTFFTISGFLMTHVFLKDMSIGQSFNIFHYYIHRYIRLTPAFMALVLSTIYITPHFGSGALWESLTNQEVQDCRRNWWTMLLYVHNYVGVTDNRCLTHTWYLAPEMQYFWLSPLVLYPLAKKPKLGLGILAVFFIASVATTVKIACDNEYSTVVKILSPNIDVYMEKFYFPSHVRAGPLLVGIFFGYLHFTRRERSTGKVTKWVGWLLTIAVFLMSFVTTITVVNKDYKYNIVWESVYTALARPGWGFAISWIIYASLRGFGGPISTFLSFSIYNPLSRLSYSAYLVHFQILHLKWRAARTTDYFRSFNDFYVIFAGITLSLIFGFFFNLVFETPFVLLEKVINKKCKQLKNYSKKELELGQV